MIDKRYHLCDCEFCVKKSTCVVCGSIEELHRAHIIPRHVLSQFIEADLLEREWISFDSFNVITLCKKHHREFDTFQLVEVDKMRDIVDEQLQKFVDATQGMHTFGLLLPVIFMGL